MTSNYEKQVDIGRQYFLKYDPEKTGGEISLINRRVLFIYPVSGYGLSD